MITLCLDFGNTRFKGAIFSDENFVESFVLENDSNEEMGKVLDKYQPTKAILSSVVNHNPEIEPLLESRSQFHKLSKDSIINFTTPVGKPETIGADRLALCAAAARFYPERNNLIIALGSCITYNFLNQYHQFLGGGISPGMDMRFKSMHQFTAKLPLIEASWNFPLVGYDTKTNILSGVITGMTSEIDGIIEKYEEKYRNFNVVLTGGNSTYFASQLKKKIFADYNFLFKGLYALSELNNCPA